MAPRTIKKIVPGVRMEDTIRRAWNIGHVTIRLCLKIYKSWNRMQYDSFFVEPFVYFNPRYNVW